MKIKCETKPGVNAYWKHASVIGRAFACLIAVAAVGLGALSVQAAPGGKPGPAAHARAAQIDNVRHDGRRDDWKHNGHARHHWKRGGKRGPHWGQHWGGQHWDKRKYRRHVIHGRVIYVPHNRVRHYGRVLVVRPYGHRYRGYGYHRHDRDSRRWLALTAITVRLLDRLSEHQQRVYEAAQVRATTAPVGEVIHWRDGAARGAVVAVRDGVSTEGRYCREFQQTVAVAGRTEQAYGTACRQPDGAWEVISAGQ